MERTTERAHRMNSGRRRIAAAGPLGSHSGGPNACPLYIRIYISSFPSFGVVPIASWSVHSWHPIECGRQTTPREVARDRSCVSQSTRRATCTRRGVRSDGPSTGPRPRLEFHRSLNEAFFDSDVPRRPSDSYRCFCASVFGRQLLEHAAISVAGRGRGGIKSIHRSVTTMREMHY